MAVMAWTVQLLSAAPQLTEITLGRCSGSWAARLTAFRKPASVLGAKYTTIRAPGALAPTTSMSSITSPSGPLGSPVGLLRAPSTPTALTLGALIPAALK